MGIGLGSGSGNEVGSGSGTEVALGLGVGLNEGLGVGVTELVGVGVALVFAATGPSVKAKPSANTNLSQDVFERRTKKHLNYFE